jgi:hypothetical protein
MRTKAGIALALLAVWLAGADALRADDAILSLHPWADNSKLVRDPAWSGVWDLDDSWLRLVLAIELHDDGEYLLTLSEQEVQPAVAPETDNSDQPVCAPTKPVIRFWARLYEIRHQTILELRPAAPSDELLLQLPVRTVLFARLMGDRLTLQFASSAWLKKSLSAGQTELFTVEAGDALLVTSPTEDLYEFLDFNVWDERAFSEQSVTFIRRR